MRPALPLWPQRRPEQAGTACLLVSNAPRFTHFTKPLNVRHHMRGEGASHPAPGIQDVLSR